MGIQYLSYLDIPVGRRIEKGTAALNELRRSLGHPGLSDVQRQEITAKIARVVGWINGTLEAVDPDVPHCEPYTTPPQPQPAPSPHPQQIGKKQPAKDDEKTSKNDKNPEVASEELSEEPQ